MKILQIFFLVLGLHSSFIYAEENSEEVQLLYQKITVLEQQISSLRALIEENAYLMQRSQELQQQRYLDIDKRLYELSGGEEPKGIFELTSNNEVEASSEDYELIKYKESLELFEIGRYSEASQSFIELIIEYPNGVFVADSYFWSGEIYLAQEMLEDAREKYLVIVNKYINHKRTPDAFYKLGEIELKLQNKSMAIDYFKAVAENYPEQAIAQLAEKSLNNLQEESNLIE